MKRYQSKRNQIYTPRKSFSAKKFERKSRNKFLFTIIITIFLVYALFAWILPGLIGGLSYMNRFKSTPSTEPSLPQDASLAPPVLNIPYESTNTAAIKISGYASPKTTIQIYIDDELRTTAQTDDGGSFTTEDLSLNLGTNNIYGKTADNKGIQSLASKTIQIIYDNEKPELEIKEPEDNKTINGGEKKVTIAGSTEPNSSVTINDTRVIINNDGSFSKTIDLNDGENNIIITTKDKAGNSTKISRKVVYQPS